MMADLCMFGLAACDERGQGFVNMSVRTITNAKEMHRHASGVSNSSEKLEPSGTWVHQVAQAMEEQLREDMEELKVWDK